MALTLLPLERIMLEIKGKKYNTLSDAAKHFGVSPKAVRDWVKKQIISSPPSKPFGAREVDIYPEEYLKQAEVELAEHRQKRKKT